MNQKSGSIKGYNFSTANKESNILWNSKSMFEYLTNPKKYIPGTKMLFAGLKKENEKLGIIF